MPRRERRGRVLGSHRRTLSLHPVRHVSLRRAVAAGGRMSAVCNALRAELTTVGEELAAARLVDDDPGRGRGAAPGWTARYVIRTDGILGRVAADVPPFNRGLLRRIPVRHRTRSG